MESETKVKLEIYYGDILQQINTCSDWHLKRKLIKKLKAIEVLLDIDYLT